MQYVPEETQRLIDEEIQGMRGYLRETLQIFDWQRELHRIGVKYRLNEGQISSLIVETFMIMTGLNNIQVYVQGLRNHVGVSEVDAKKITKDVAERVFGELQKVLVEVTRDLIPMMQKKLAEMEGDTKQKRTLAALGIEIGEEGVTTTEPNLSPARDVSMPSPIPVPQKDVSLTDHVLRNSVTAEHTESDHSLDTSAKSSGPAYVGNDPYHEPIEE